AYTLFAGTIEDLVAARAREGQRLRELIEQRCNGLEALVAHVRTRLPEVHTRVRARLNERLAELKAQLTRSASSRSWRSSCNASTSMRSSTASPATSPKSAAS